MRYGYLCWRVILTSLESPKLGYHDWIDSSEINIQNYELLRKDRDDRHGGVAIYFHSRLEVNQVHLPNIHCVKLETLWIKLKLPNTRPIYTGIVYGPIICNKFFEELEVVFDEVICLGDFNCDSLKPNDWQWKKLHGIMSTRQLSQVISKPTRITCTSETLIDHIWTARLEMYCINGVIMLYVNCKKIPKGPARNIRARSYRTFKEIDFINDLRNASFNDVDMSNSPDQALAWCVFEGIFIRICDKHAPFKQIKVHIKAPSWLNGDYIFLRKKLEQAKIHAQSTQSPTGTPIEILETRPIIWPKG